MVRKKTDSARKVGRWVVVACCRLSFAHHLQTYLHSAALELPLPDKPPLSLSACQLQPVRTVLVHP